MPDEFHLGGNGAGTAEDVEETREELEGALIKLSDLKARNGQLTTLTPQQQSLLKIMDSGPADTKDRFTDLLRHGNLIDDDEMWKHIAAYNEAVYLGMDTEFNVQALEGLRGTNRKGGFRSNLIAAFLDSFSHQKYTTNQPRGKDSGSTNPRSPLN